MAWKEFYPLNLIFDDLLEFLPYESPGTSYFHLQMYDRAILALEKERKRYRDHPTLLLYLGFSYVYGNHFEKAKEIFLYIVQTAPLLSSRHFAYCGLALLDVRKKNYESAIEYFEHALSITMNIDVLYNLGMCHYLQQRPHIAFPFFQEVIEHRCYEEHCFYFLGKCFLELNEFEKALDVWFSGLQTIESFPFLLTLALEFEELGLYRTAIHCYERLTLLGYNDVQVRHGIAWNFGLLDERDTAMDHFEALLSEFPHHVNSWISYFMLLYVWKERERFQLYYERWKKQHLSHPLIEKICQLQQF